MCTTGAIAAFDHDGRPIVFVTKTSDYMPSGMWHAAIEGKRGHHILGSNRWEVMGINAGMNRMGLAVVRSFLDYRGPFEIDKMKAESSVDFPFDLDRRGAIAAAMLERCSSVDEGVSYLLEVIPRHCHQGSGQRGSNFMLADSAGRIAVVECCEDRLASQYYPEGYTARGNNGCLILKEEQMALPDFVRQDREQRRRRMLDGVREIHDGIPKGMSKAEALTKLKKTCSWHGLSGASAPGAICAHGIRAPGTRTNSGEPFWTNAGVIFDLVEKTMHYAPGNPCRTIWRKMTFT
jgi:hypothetical protein